MPEAYLNSTARPFLTGLPAARDETRLLDGYPGEFCIMARRKGKTWYVAGISAGEGRTISLDLSSLLQHDQYGALYEDSPAGKDLMIVRKSLVSPSKPLKLHLNKFGGFAL